MSIQGNWILKKVDGDQIGGGVTFNFSGGYASYSYGNDHSHTYTVDGSHIKFGFPMSTRMGVNINPPESFVTGAVEHSNQWKIDGNTLTLSQDGKPRVTLQKA